MRSIGKISNYKAIKFPELAAKANQNKKIIVRLLKNPFEVLGCSNFV